MTKKQNKFIDDLAWKHRISKSKLGRALIKYYIENPDKLEELLDYYVKAVKTDEESEFESLNNKKN